HVLGAGVGVVGPPEGRSGGRIRSVVERRKVWRASSPRCSHQAATRAVDVWKSSITHAGAASVGTVPAVCWCSPRLWVQLKATCRASWPQSMRLASPHHPWWRPAEAQAMADTRAVASKSPGSGTSWPEHSSCPCADTFTHTRVNTPARNGRHDRLANILRPCSHRFLPCRHRVRSCCSSAHTKGEPGCRKPFTFHPLRPYRARRRTEKAR